MKKSFILIIVCLVLVCLFAFAFTACHSGKYKMQDFVVSFENFDKNYEIGDKIDFSTITMYATFSDDSKETIPLDKVSIKVDGVELALNELSKITETVGTKVIEIKYSNIVRQVTIRVDEKHVAVLTGVRVDASNWAKTYSIGDTVSLQGLKVYAIYDGTDETEIPTNDSNIAIFMEQENITSNLSRLTQELGTKNIKVRYQTMYAQDSIPVVVNDVYEDLTINVPTNFVTTYNVGATISTQGITATANYRSGAIVNDIEVKFYIGTEEVNFATLSQTKGNKTVVAKSSYEGKNVEKNITFVVNNFVTGIALDTTTAVLEFVEDDPISIASFSNVKVNVSYADSSDDAPIHLDADGISCVNTNDSAIVFENLTNTSGEKTIKVKYAGFEDAFTIIVLERNSSLDSLTVSTQPTTTEFVAGGDVSLAGLEITGVYKTELAKDDDVIAFEDFAANGVKLYYNDVEVTDINTLAEISPLGRNMVTVSVKYLGKTVTFPIYVTNSITSIELDTSNTKVSYLIHENIDFFGLKIRAICNYQYFDYVGLVAGVSIFDGTTDVTDSLNTLTNSLSNSKAVTVKYSGCEASFNISVEDYIISISHGTTDTFIENVNTTPGSVAALNGLEVFANYESGASVLLSDGITYENNSITVPVESKTVNIKYGTFNTTVTLTVLEVLNSISVDSSSIPLNIVEGGTVNLTGLRVFGTFAYAGVESLNILQEDGVSFIYGVVAFAIKNGDVYDSLTQLELATISATAGTKTVRISYTYNNVPVSVDFEMTIDSSEGLTVTGYELPVSIINYNSTLTQGRTYQDQKDSSQFESVLFVKDEEEYLVGDDNDFKFLPNTTILNMTTETYNVMTSFDTSTKIYMYVNNSFTELEYTTNWAAHTRTYVYNDMEYVIEKFTENKYKFTEAAIDKKFKLSVIPDTAKYSLSNGINAVEWTVTVVDGYNISDPRELCLLEQPGAEYTQKYNRHHWDSIKSELGLTGVRPTSIILHDNLIVTKDSIPESMMYTFDSNYNIKYTINGVSYSPEEVPAEYGGPLSRTFIYDKLGGDGEYALFRYDMQNKEHFSIHGNFFDINLSQLPLVCPFEPLSSVTNNLESGYDIYYMPYMSKLSFIEVAGEDITAAQVVTDPMESETNDEYFDFENFAVKGNCNPHQLLVHKDTDMVSGETNPVYGGGIIFVKTYYCRANITNINAHTCFISFYSRDYTVVKYENVKSYDTFNNALFVNGETYNTLTNCYFKRSSGPLVILCQGDDDLNWDDTDGKEYKCVPQLTADTNCDFECLVTGGEQWFITNNAPIEMISILNPSLINSVGKTFLKTIKDDNNKEHQYFNLIFVSILEGSDPGAFGDTSTHGAGVQAYIEYGNELVDRREGDAIYDNVKTIIGGYNAPIAAVGPSTAHVMAIINPNVGGGVLLNPQTMSPVESGDTIHKAFNGTLNGSHEYMTIYYAGFGIMTGMWDSSEYHEIVTP